MAWNVDEIDILKSFEKLKSINIEQKLLVRNNLYIQFGADGMDKALANEYLKKVEKEMDLDSVAHKLKYLD